MIFTNLADSPQYIDKTITLIESSFEYLDENSFQIDFYPLIKKDNHNQCYILIDNNEVLAHIGVKKRSLTINNKNFPFTMYGAIAVDENYRGKGIFKYLFNKILPLHQSTFHLLWSDKVELYERFGFLPCIELNEYGQKSSDHGYKIKKTNLSLLSDNELDKIKELYHMSEELRVERSAVDWNDLTQINSAAIYLIFDQSSEIANYFIIGKGQDLEGIIHEYGYVDETFLNVFTNYGKLWTPLQFQTNCTTLFASLLKIGSHEQFIEFVRAYSNINIGQINHEITFEFDGELFQMKQNEFLHGIFGPGRFKELSIPKICISGLDSI